MKGFRAWSLAGTDYGSSKGMDEINKRMNEIVD